MATYVVNCIWIILGFKRKRPILVIVDTTFSNQWVSRSWLGQPISCVELNSWLIRVDFQITSWFRVYNSEITWNQTLKAFFWTTHVSLNYKLHWPKKYIFFLLYTGPFQCHHTKHDSFITVEHICIHDIYINHPHNSTALCYQHVKNWIFCFYLKDFLMLL
jgi:hypothetical protein